MLKKSSALLLVFSLSMSSFAGTGFAKKDTVNLKDDVLSNEVIKGDLHITPAAGKNITLDNVSVEGTVYIKGKAPESLTIHNSSLQTLSVKTSSHETSFTVSGDSIIENTLFDGNGSLTENELTADGFKGVSLLNGSSLELSGEFTAVTAEGKNKGQSKQLNQLSVDGVIDQLILNALTDVDHPLDSLIKSLHVSTLAAGSSLNGDGVIEDAELETALELNGVSTQNPEDFVSPWSLIWQDEFNGTEIDRSKWDFEIGNGFYDANGTFVPGWGNNEKQYYTDRPENAKTEDGNLVITAREEEYEGFSYTSARLRTKGLFAKTYGKFEMKASLPTGKGYWPAFWMLPEEDRYGGWAASGEIDILEAQGSNPHHAIGTIHYGETWPNNKYTGAEYTFPDGSTIADEHVYSVEWEPGEIRWYVDGVLTQTQNNWYSKEQNAAANHTYPAPFDQPFHMLLNLAIGGNFDGDPTEDTMFPQSMNVDYVRVYDLTGRPYQTPELPEVVAEPLPEDAKLPLEDGNLVYNNDFTEDTGTVKGVEGVPGTDHWYFLALPDFGGQASLSIDELDGRNFAKADIQNGGNQPYAIQLIQDVTIGKGRYYKVSFDAKSASNRDINVKVSGDADRDYSTYSSSESFSLTNEVQPYETVFQMTEETDLKARLEFNLGLSTHPVWIGNVRIEETTAPEIDPDASKSPLKNGNLIYNGTFDQGFPDRLLYWNVLNASSDDAVSVDPERRVLTVNDSDAQLVQKGIQLQSESPYELALEVKADQSDVQIELLSEDGSTVYASEVISADEEWSTQNVAFTMPDITDLNAQFVVSFGGEGNVELDNLSLKRVGGPAGETPIKNGTFDGSLEPWVSYFHWDAAPSSLQLVNDQALIQIGQQSAEPWGVQLYQENLSLLPGKPYTLKFDASSTVDRKMEVTVEDAAYARSLSEVVELTADQQTYEFTFTPATQQALSLKFLLGKIAGESNDAHEVKIDNVTLE
ncbi:carbohydrate binding domain-containing protein [Jeotgalibacillus haloalkalitolerans]|uniref:Carbohydrate binding domain-containing protein n=1 Tax=Jeotgalibacillus haloalkalitolerans TaxID=3104292 RepID=A0ABU5KJN5_9BACL|nr:carbohydrate binding domain-containing protein [Jeotgalibacillus sp. HH7-29]MDZ5711131.1 carbohydrate binding domain-containing protein [Jeotgalibacillus sp. HH7-29]